MAHGKALLVIERVEARRPQDFEFDVRASVHSCNGCEAWAIRDELEQMIQYDTYPAPDAAYKLAIGDKIWVKVTWEIYCRKDYWGEVDCDLEYFKQKVIRRRLASKG